MANNNDTSTISVIKGLFKKGDFSLKKLNSNQIKPDIKIPETLFKEFYKKNEKDKPDEWGKIESINWKETKDKLLMNLNLSAQSDLRLGGRNLDNLLKHLEELKKNGLEVSFNPNSQTIKICMNSSKMIEEVVKIPDNPIEKKAMNKQYAESLKDTLEYRGGRYKDNLKTFLEQNSSTNHWGEDVQKNIREYIELSLVVKFLEENKLNDAFKAHISDINGNGKEINGKYEPSEMAKSFYKIYEGIDKKANLNASRKIEELIETLEKKTSNEYASPFANIIRNNFPETEITKFKESLQEHINNQLVELKGRLSPNQLELANSQINKNYQEIENNRLDIKPTSGIGMGTGGIGRI